MIQNTMVQKVGDAALATGAVTSPFWLTLITDWVGLVAAVGGLILLAFRLYPAYLDFRARWDKRKEKSSPSEGS